MDVERLKRLCHANPLVVVDDSYDDPRVKFYSDEDEHGPVVSLLIRDGEAITASSTCLPTRGWETYADAYARAASFIRRAGLTDGGEE